ncbi:MAG: rRNA maturation RNase YbeY [Caldicoprobacterales bacterium]
MILLIENRQNSIIMEDLQGFFEGIMQKAFEYLKLDLQLEVSLLLTDNEEIQRLNREYRGRDNATDVLSFPLLNLNPFDRETWLSDLEVNRTPGTGETVIGDIVISVEKAREQAQEYNQDIKRELGFLAIHGLLHLLGFDHERDQTDEQVMKELQEAILLRCNLPRE